MPTKNNFVGSIPIECILVRTFSCLKIDSRKAQESELPIFDENRRAVGVLHAMRDKNEGT